MPVCKVFRFATASVPIGADPCYTLHKRWETAADLYPRLQMNAATYAAEAAALAAFGYLKPNTPEEIRYRKRTAQAREAIARFRAEWLATQR